MDLHFYNCDICGKVIATLSSAGIPTECCGQVMKELVPNKTDGAFEKHVPVFSINENTVQVCVGSVPHPMTYAHSITWIGIRTSCGFQFRQLHPGLAPCALFTLSPDERVEAVYAYCDVHGLWCAEDEA